MARAEPAWNSDFAKEVCCLSHRVIDDPNRTLACGFFMPETRRDGPECAEKYAKTTA